jgi:hypothetical protein
VKGILLQEEEEEKEEEEEFSEGYSYKKKKKKKRKADLGSLELGEPDLSTLVTDQKW